MQFTSKPAQNEIHYLRGQLSTARFVREDFIAAPSISSPGRKPLVTSGIHKEVNASTIVLTQGWTDLFYYFFVSFFTAYKRRW